MVDYGKNKRDIVHSIMPVSGERLKVPDEIG